MSWEDAYTKRRKRYHNELMALADEFKSRGYVVRYHERGCITGITIYDAKLENGVRLQFNEVPYRWTLEYDIKPSREQGSGWHSRDERFDAEGGIPFTIDELIKEFKPMYIDQRFEKYHKTH